MEEGKLKEERWKEKKDIPSVHLGIGMSAESRVVNAFGFFDGMEEKIAVIRIGFAYRNELYTSQDLKIKNDSFFFFIFSP